MDKWIIIETDSLIQNHKSKFTSVELVNGQSLIRVDEANEMYFMPYKKYTAEEIKAMDLDSTFKHLSLTPRAYKNLPFKDKFHEDGSKLYEHVHGVNDAFAINETKTLRIKVPYVKCFFTEAEITNASAGTVTDFKFQVDNGAGGYVDVYTHGHSVNIPKDFYNRKSNYEAQLTNTLYVAATVTNGNEERNIGLNILLHEAKL